MNANHHHTPGGLAILPLVVMVQAAMGSYCDQAMPGDMHHSNTSFLIGYMAPTSWALQTFDAVNMAVEDYMAANPNSTLNITVHLQRDGAYDTCDPSQGMRVAQALLASKVDVVMGAICSKVHRHVGFLWSYWGVPWFSFGATDPAFNDRQYYNTLIRVGSVLSNVGEALVELHNQMKWKMSTLIYRETGLCNLGARNILETFQQTNHVSLVGLKLLAEDKELTDSDMRTELQLIRTRSRIVILCLMEDEMQRFMRLASELDMTTPEYVYIYYTDLPSGFTLQPWVPVAANANSTVEDTATLKAAFKRMKILTITGLSGSNSELFLDNYVTRMRQHNSFPDILPINGTNHTNFSPSRYALNVYDGAMMYLRILSEILAAGEDPHDGRLYLRHARDKVFQGLSGAFFMNKLGDRVASYHVWHLLAGRDEFSVWENINMTQPAKPVSKRVQVQERTEWDTPDGRPPPDLPVCGFFGERCQSTSARDLGLILGGLGLLVLILAICGLTFYHRHWTFERDISSMGWRINYDDISFSPNRLVRGSFMTSSLSSGTGNKALSMDSSQHTKHFTRVGLYNGQLVSLKPVIGEGHKLSRQELIDLKLMREVLHENVNLFVGACHGEGHLLVVSLYCAKGSLQDVLLEEEITLDAMFKASLLNDIANGMFYLHNSPLQVHGSLRSTSCLIDSRWTVKLACFGLQALRMKGILQEDNTGKLFTGLHGLLSKRQVMKRSGEERLSTSLLWTAPEILRNITPDTYKGTKKGDVYSFGIIMHEVLYRVFPYSQEDLTPLEIIEQVKNPAIMMRPKANRITTEKVLDNRVLRLMERCWDEHPDNRPDFSYIKRQMIHFNNGKPINILDSMLMKLENYATNLEEIVSRRTEELSSEKRKTDSLLYKMLPPSVAETLKKGGSVAPEMFSAVTIYFSDVVGFTSISRQSTPMEVVDLLNDLYTMFDDIIDRHDVYKVETIGDAYMVVSGAPKRNGDQHAAEVANMTLALLNKVQLFRIRHLPMTPLQIRIGLHTGPCAAGVVGHTMPHYCLFGDTVNTASRMESTGEAMRVHISKSCYAALTHIGGYVMEYRGIIDVKGLGPTETYWLNGINLEEED